MPSAHASAPAPAYDLDAYRKRIPLLASLIPMNNCSQAPQTDITRAAAERYLDSWNRTGMDWDASMPLEGRITCPHCRSITTQVMPEDACVYVFARSSLALSLA